jgi:hypothetical protein
MQQCMYIYLKYYVKFHDLTIHTHAFHWSNVGEIYSFKGFRKLLEGEHFPHPLAPATEILDSHLRLSKRLLL